MPPSNSERQVLSSYTKHTLSHSNIQDPAASRHREQVKTAVADNTNDHNGAAVDIDGWGTGLKRKTSEESNNLGRKRRRQQALISPSNARQEVRELQVPVPAERTSETADGDGDDSHNSIAPVACPGAEAQPRLRPIDAQLKLQDQEVFSMMKRICQKLMVRPPTSEQFLGDRASCYLFVMLCCLRICKDTIPFPTSQIEARARPPCGFNYAPVIERPSDVAIGGWCFIRNVVEAGDLSDCSPAGPMFPETYNEVTQIREVEPDEDIPSLHNALAWQSEHHTPQICWDLADCGIELEYRRPLAEDLELSAFDPPLQHIVIVHADGAVPFRMEIGARPGQPHLTLACLVRGLHYALQHIRVPRQVWDEMCVYDRLHVAHAAILRAALPLAHPVFIVVERYRAAVNAALDKLPQRHVFGHPADGRCALDIFEPDLVAQLNELLTRVFVSNAEGPMTRTTFVGGDLLIGHTMFMGLQYLGPPYYWQLKTTTRNIARMKRTAWDRRVVDN